MGAVKPLKRDTATSLPAELQAADTGLVVGQATLDASGLTAARTLALPDVAGTLATARTQVYYVITGTAGSALAAWANGIVHNTSTTGAFTLTVDGTLFSAGDVILVRQASSYQLTVAAAAGSQLILSGPTAKTAQLGSMIYIEIGKAGIDATGTNVPIFVGGEVAAS